MNITAKITGIKYTPFLCRELNSYRFDAIERAMERDATFILRINSKRQIAVSWWVSAKRTRSYPYARVYDSLGFYGKKVTIIPILKDEGKNGDRDFLQWDTVSLMSLLGIYVIIAYYKTASKNPDYTNKITNQKFDFSYIKKEINNLLPYQSDALHWNLSQLDIAGEVGQKALEAYAYISEEMGVEMHSESSAEKRIKKILEGKETFMALSRDLAEKAQIRESVTLQPKEKLSGKKGVITIKNYLGGHYFFTSDEVEIHGRKIHLIEGKHTRRGNLPSLSDIKDGLLRMILLTNLEDVKIGEESYIPVPILKLTTRSGFRVESLNKKQRIVYSKLRREAQINGFQLSFG